MKAHRSPQNNGDSTVARPRAKNTCTQTINSLLSFDFYFEGVNSNINEVNLKKTTRLRRILTCF